MTYRLRTPEPYALSSYSYQGFPTVLSRSSDPPEVPGGYAYIPVIPFPSEDPPEGFRWVRKVTETEFGWEAAEIPATPVPEEVTRRQLHLAMLMLPTPITRDMILAAIDQMPEPEKSFGEVSYREAVSFRRDNELVGQLAGAFGLDDAAVDQLFLVASQIED